MKKLLSILVCIGFIYAAFFHPLWIVIPFAIVALALVALFIWGLREVDNHEKGVKKYLDECDEKLRKGEMTKEENDQIHFYWQFENWDF